MEAAQEKQVSTITLSGGVAAGALQDYLRLEKAQQAGIRLLPPTFMPITAQSRRHYHLYQQGVRSSLDLSAYAESLKQTADYDQASSNLSDS